MNIASKFTENQEKEYIEKIVQIKRVTRTVKGGHRMRFRVLVVVGNKKGKVGYGIAKANDISAAVAKATKQAKKNCITVPIVNDTIPYQITIKNGASHIMLKPAPKGTSILAGGSVRAVIEVSGIKNIVAKIIGTSNKAANIKSLIEGLASFNPKE